MARYALLGGGAGVASASAHERVIDVALVHFCFLKFPTIFIMSSQWEIEIVVRRVDDKGTRNFSKGREVNYVERG
jgi:hypothetical protein